MDEGNEVADGEGDEAMADIGKVKLESKDVVVKTEPKEWPETENGKAIDEAANDESECLPSTSSDSNSKHSVILKKEMKRRLSDEKPFKIISEIVKKEMEEDDEKPLDLLSNNKEEIGGRNLNIKTELRIEVKDEVEGEPEKEKEAKPVFEMKHKMENEEDISFNRRRIPKSERVEIENGRKPKVKLDGGSTGCEMDVKPGAGGKKMMRTKAKWLESEKVKEEPGTQGETKLRNDILDETKKEPDANGETKPLIGMKAKIELKKEGTKKERMIKKEEGSINAVPQGPTNSSQNRNKGVEPESVGITGQSPIVIVDSDDEMSKPAFETAPPGAATERSEVSTDMSQPSTPSALAESEVEEFQCRHCKRVFPSKTICKAHIREQCKKHLKCRICNKRFPSPSHLNIHLRIHSGEKPFVCGVGGCVKRFTEKGNVITHRRTHTGVKPFVCDHTGCGKPFANRSHLDRHKLSHSSERPFICDNDGCGKAFASNQTLVQHQRIHTNEKPFVCNITRCGKTFTRNGDLFDHKSVHSSEKSFICAHTGCGKAFKQRSTLSSHKRIHEKDN